MCAGLEHSVILLSLLPPAALQLPPFTVWYANLGIAPHASSETLTCLTIERGRAECDRPNVQLIR